MCKINKVLIIKTVLKQCHHKLLGTYNLNVNNINVFKERFK